MTTRTEAQKRADALYRQTHKARYKTVTIHLLADECEDLDKTLKERHISKADFARTALKNLKDNI